MCFVSDIFVLDGLFVAKFCNIYGILNVNILVTAEKEWHDWKYNLSLAIILRIDLVIAMSYAFEIFKDVSGLK